MKAISASLRSQFSFISSLLLLLVASSYACSDFLVTPGASHDDSAMIAYNADDAALYGVLYHYPATYNNTEEEVVQIYDWDSGVSVQEMKFEEDCVQKLFVLDQSHHSCFVRYSFRTNCHRNILARFRR